MNKHLQRLSKTLRQAGLGKYAEEIDSLQEYDEPWHEEAVKEFGEEIKDIDYEELIPESKLTQEDFYSEWEKTHIEKKDVFNEIIKKHNIKPISFEKFVSKNINDMSITKHPWDTGFIEEFNKKMKDDPNYDKKRLETPVLGAGAFGVVIRAIYKKKPVAAKLTVVSESEKRNSEWGINDIKVWDKILKIKDKLPDDLKRHIPTIYDTIVGKIEVGNIKYDYSIILMEELKPIGREIKRILKSVEFIPNVNEEGMFEIAQSIIKDIQYRYSNSFMPAGQLRDYEKFINEYDDKRLFKIIYNSFSRDYDSLSQKLEKELINDFNQRFARSLSSDIADKFVILNPVPRDFEDYNSFVPEGPMSATPEVASFRKFIIYLYENYGIKWQDLHANNIMLDVDGNLNIMDVGCFKIGSPGGNNTLGSDVEKLGSFEPLDKSYKVSELSYDE